MTVVEYAVTTGVNVTPEQASDGLFPGMRVVLIGQKQHWRSVTYFFLVDQDGETLSLP